MEYCAKICRVDYLMQMLYLNEAIDQFPTANSVSRYGHVLRREDGHVLRSALEFVAEDERRKGKPKRKWKRLVEEECMKPCLNREDALS